MSNKHCKVVIFDLDETLGYFTQLDIFVRCLEKYYNKNISNNEFFDIIDLFDKYLRPNILHILKYLKDKKDKKFCSKIMLYTNNNGGKVWPQKLVDYFNYKLDYQLFDNVICTFKIRDKIIEPNRTSNNKIYNDVIRCSKIPSNTYMFPSGDMAEWVQLQKGFPLTKLELNPLVPSSSRSRPAKVNFLTV